MIEPIEKVIERCEFRIERALNCNVDDIRRLIEEAKKQTPVKTQSLPLWHGLGTGD